MALLWYYHALAKNLHVVKYVSWRRGFALDSLSGNFIEVYLLLLLFCCWFLFAWFSVPGVWTVFIQTNTQLLALARRAQGCNPSLHWQKTRVEIALRGALCAGRFAPCPESGLWAAVGFPLRYLTPADLCVITVGMDFLCAPEYNGSAYDCVVLFLYFKWMHARCSWSYFFSFLLSCSADLKDSLKCTYFQILPFGWRLVLRFGVSHYIEEEYIVVTTLFRRPVKRVWLEVTIWTSQSGLITLKNSFLLIKKTHVNNFPDVYSLFFLVSFLGNG